MSQHQIATLTQPLPDSSRNSTFNWQDGATLFAPDEWTLLQSHNAATRELWTAGWENTVFPLADERARVHLEVQSLQNGAELKCRVAQIQSDSDESTALSGALLRQVARATLAPKQFARWSELTSRRDELDARLAWARCGRLWLEEHPATQTTGPTRGGNILLRQTPLIEARIALGLREGFDGPTASLTEVRNFLGEWLRRANHPFTVSVVALDVVYATGNESGAFITLLDDPRFPVGEAILRERALHLGQALLVRFRQHRLSVLVGAEAIILEESAS